MKRWFAYALLLPGLFLLISCFTTSKEPHSPAVRPARAPRTLSPDREVAEPAQPETETPRKS
ncbi:hypothetical protein MUN82_12670 [Hymenobacter aerilatus]|uniref:Uncharacterized protein n=1 Tax=Hymenobacter aerilatus TaxID=2932251 RepID=A0A8T9SUA1_9BACT|nr:hypothetical protein [Hymenobacter aerilatus]UOR03800.1 hypothetical protein MUN82_12670 [Hymenobacter aerilatus]